MKDADNTHLINVWFSNTYYDNVREMVRQARDEHQLARMMRDFVSDLFPRADGLAADIVKYFCDDVDFDDIAQGYIDEDANVQECSHCHVLCNGDQSINDHGMCTDCMHELDKEKDEEED